VQTGGTLTVTVQANFNGANTTGQITGGTLILQGGFAQGNSSSQQSFVATGSHTTVFNGGGSQTISFATPAASHFQNLEIDGPGTVTLGSAVNVTGQLISTTGPTPVVGAGNTLTVAGLNADGMVLDNTLLISNNGTITQFDNVTFQNYAAAAT